MFASQFGFLSQFNNPDASRNIQSYFKNIGNSAVQYYFKVSVTDFCFAHCLNTHSHNSFTLFHRFAQDTKKHVTPPANQAIKRALANTGRDNVLYLQADIERNNNIII